MKCDELEAYKADVTIPVYGTIADAQVYLKKDVDAAIAELKAENERLKKCEIWMKQHFYCEEVIACESAKNRRLKRALWLMTAEWAEGMGLASCNIAIKLSFKERFFYHDEANREKDIKKYRHRQVVFYKYADYCRAKAEEYK
ncbi:MAG: hypothetical protein II850_07525 [Fibrobacter sp.]|nr:hypothetical protein [Fibrobacter sp.]